MRLSAPASGRAETDPDRPFSKATGGVGFASDIRPPRLADKMDTGQDKGGKNHRFRDD